MKNPIQQNAQLLLPTVTDRERFWQWKNIKPLAMGLLRLLPAIAFFGLWLSNQLGMWLSPDDNQDKTEWLWLAVTYPLLIGWALVMLRLSDKFAQQGWLIPLLVAFVAPLALITLLPTAWMSVSAMIFMLGAVSIAFLPRSWQAIQDKWYGGFSPNIQAHILSIMHHFEALAMKAHSHYPAIVEGLLGQVKEMAQDIAQTNPRDARDFEGFLSDFGQHFLPVFAAVSFRVKTDELPDNTRWFIETYHPVDADTKQQLNWIKRYFETAIRDDLSDNLSIIWLKSGLLASDKKGKADADQLLDFHLTLLKRLLKQPAELHTDDIELSVYACFRLANDMDMNLFQQNSFADMIETIVANQDAQQHGYLSNAKSLYPNVMRHFEKKLIAIPEDKIEAYHDSIMARNERVQNALQQLTPAKDEHYTHSLTGLLAYISERPEAQLVLIIRHAADLAMMIALAIADEATQQAFWQACAKVVHIDKLQEHYNRYTEEASNPDLVKQVSALHHLTRIVLAVESYDEAAQAKETDEADSNYTNETDRYEYDIEHRLNQALYHKVNEVQPAFVAVLTELQQDIEQQNLKLDAFLAHLRHKFDELANSLQQTNPEAVLSWFLTLQHTATPSNTGDNALHQMIHWQSEFRLGIVEDDRFRLFSAISAMTLHLLTRYPLDAELTHGCLVTSLEMMAMKGIDESSIDTYLAQLLPVVERRLLQLMPETAETLTDIIQRSMSHYELVDSERLTQDQKAILGRLILQS